MFASQQHLCNGFASPTASMGKKRNVSQHLLDVWGQHCASLKTDSLARASRCPHAGPISSSFFGFFSWCRYDWIIIHLRTSVVAKERLLLPDIILGWYFKLKDWLYRKKGGGWRRKKRERERGSERTQLWEHFLSLLVEIILFLT